MRTALAGPGNNKYKPKVLDPGKTAPAGTSGGYRRVGAASGPTSSQDDYTATLDPGKSLPVSSSGAHEHSHEEGHSHEAAPEESHEAAPEGADEAAPEDF
eukprot:TRINITY_DN294_c0_g2_i1.p2 TRINITY_DN294_c0_g2~~TRINITY_DN294_c0_g2_i1.p2  ORF type:complete len:109 (-),score=10.79 TRINITY_DN294_c0_g2_i1:155-454(-)